jgi:hypothetical protein
LFSFYSSAGPVQLPGPGSQLHHHRRQDAELQADPQVSQLFSIPLFEDSVELRYCRSKSIERKKDHTKIHIQSFNLCAEYGKISKILGWKNIAVLTQIFRQLMN